MKSVKMYFQTASCGKVFVSAHIIASFLEEYLQVEHLFVMTQQYMCSGISKLN
jgi:hypothetical protein